MSLERGGAAIGELAGRVLAEVERAVVGKRRALELVLMGLLADGHVLIEDYPGLAKTLIARSFAQATSMGFARVQFMPDLLPSDITGSSIFDQRTSSFEFRPGPIFTNIVLADEINRAPPRTQAALLEAMAERRVSSEGVTRALAAPFLVIATQNPIEFEGTYPLPEAQLDRFLARISVGYPAPEDETAMLLARRDRRSDELALEPLLDQEGFLELQRAIESVHFSEAIAQYAVRIVGATRAHASVAVGASPRGSLALFKLARAQAALRGRDFVTPDDVKAIAGPALAHRLVLEPRAWVARVDPEAIVAEVLASVPTPVADEDAPPA